MAAAITLVGDTGATGSTGTSFQVVNTGVPIPAGDPLVIGIMGAAFGSATTSGLATGVTDNQGNTWTLRHNSGNQTDGASHNWSLAVYELAAGLASPAAAGALTITVTQTAPGSGGAGTVAICGYISSTAGEDTAATAFTDQNNSLTSNSVFQATAAGTLAGDLAVYFGVSYATGGSIAANAGLTLLDSLNGTGGPTVAWCGYSSSPTVAGANTYSVDVAGGASFMATWITGFEPASSNVPQTVPAQTQTQAALRMVINNPIKALTQTAALIGTFLIPNQQINAATQTSAQIGTMLITQTSNPTDLWREEYSRNADQYSQPPHDVFREITDLPTTQPVTQDSWIIRLRQWGERFF